MRNKASEKRLLFQFFFLLLNLILGAKVNNHRRALFFTIIDDRFMDKVFSVLRLQRLLNVVVLYEGSKMYVNCDTHGCN